MVDEKSNTFSFTDQEKTYFSLQGRINSEFKFFIFKFEESMTETMVFHDWVKCLNEELIEERVTLRGFR